MVETQVEQVDRLRFAIGRLARRLRLSAAAAGAGHTPTTTSVLFTIVREGPLRLSEVAEREALNPTMLSRVAGTLTDEGLIHRVSDPRDRRAVLVEATAAGRRLREKVHRQRTEALSAELARLDAADQQAIEHALPALERLAELLAERRA
jgi:DNA-binding MarR family transcriptional regulator